MCVGGGYLDNWMIEFFFSFLNAPGPVFVCSSVYISLSVSLSKYCDTTRSETLFVHYANTFAGLE